MSDLDDIKYKSPEQLVNAAIDQVPSTRIAQLEQTNAVLQQRLGEMSEAAMTLNGLEIKVELLARRNQVPSANLSKQLRDQWAEMVRLARRNAPPTPGIGGYCHLPKSTKGK